MPEEKHPARHVRRTWRHYLPCQDPRAGCGWVTGGISDGDVQEFLRDLQVTPSQSAFTTTYLQALDAYEAGDTHRALALFQRLSADHPESSVVRAKVRQLSGGQPLPAISSPLSPSSSAVVRPAPALIRAPIITERRRSGPKIVLIFVGGALILMLVVVILANYRRSTAG